MQLRELTNEEFDKFVETYKDYSVYQSKEYSFVMHKENYETSTVGLFDNGNLVGAALILFKYLDKYKYAYIPKGYLVDYTNYSMLKSFTNLIRSYLKKRKVVGIKLCPIIVKNIYDRNGNITYTNPNYDICYNNLKKLGYYHLGYNKFFEALKPRFDAVIDLKDKTTLMLFKDIKREFRTKIRTAEKKGVKIYKGKEASLKELYNLTKEKYPRGLDYLESCYRFFDEKDSVEYYYVKLDTKDFLAYAQNKFLYYENSTIKMDEKIMNNTGKNTGKTIAKKMNLDKIFESVKVDLTTATDMLRENPEGITLSAIFAVKHNKEVTILLDGYNTKYKYLNAKHYLIWTLMEKYANEGIEKFNLGGISSLDSDNPKYNGLRMFKLNFNASIVEYAGDFELMVNKSSYFFFRNKRAIKKSIKKK